MENNCYFVCSRGLLKSCTFHSPKPISSCSTDVKYLYNMLQSNKMFNGMSIYVCSDLLKFFVNKILPYLTNTFVLVSGDSDLCVPKEALSREETFILLHLFSFQMLNKFIYFIILNYFCFGKQFF